jgi:hypothetical protein
MRCILCTAQGPTIPLSSPANQNPHTANSASWSEYVPNKIAVSVIELSLFHHFSTHNLPQQQSDALPSRYIKRIAFARPFQLWLNYTNWSNPGWDAGN